MTQADHAIVHLLRSDNFVTKLQFTLYSMGTETGLNTERVHACAESTHLRSKA